MFFSVVFLSLPAAYVVSAIILWFSGARSISELLRPLVWGFLMGFIGFAIGFWGPIFWAPEANQGPLLGIFFTGPAAALLGIAAGAIRSFYVSRQAGMTN